LLLYLFCFTKRDSIKTPLCIPRLNSFFSETKSLLFVSTVKEITEEIAQKLENFSYLPFVIFVLCQGSPHDMATASQFKTLTSLSRYIFVCLISLPLLTKPPGFYHGSSTLMTLSNPNHLPKASLTNTIIRLSFCPLNASQKGN
jgi:hypothetical protein